MTTEINDVEEAPAEETHEEATESGPKQLRDALKRSQEENAELREILMQDAWAKVGLDPTQGLGKAIAKEYKGKPTAEALAEYAETEYGQRPSA